MPWYQIELNLVGRRAVVVGGGQVAARKVAGLVEAGAAVRVVSPAYCSDLAGRDDIERVPQPYAEGVVEGADLVFACTDDRELNARIAADARRLGVLCNVADDPEASGFLVPALLRHGDFTVGVGTGGAGPKLAAHVRDRLASLLGPEFGILVDELRAARGRVREQVADPALRRRIFETLCADCSVKLLATRGRDAWRAWFERLLARPLAASPEPLAASHEPEQDQGNLLLPLAASHGPEKPPP